MNTIDYIKSKEQEDIHSFAQILEQNAKKFFDEKEKMRLIKGYSVDIKVKEDHNHNQTRRRLNKKSMKFNKLKLTALEKLQFFSQFRNISKLYSSYKSIIINKKPKDLSTLPINDINNPENSHIFNLLNEDFRIKYVLNKDSFYNKLEYEEVKNSKEFPWSMINIRDYNSERIKNLFLKLISSEGVYNSKFLKNKNKDYNTNTNLSRKNYTSSSEAHLLTDKLNIIPEKQDDHNIDDNLDDDDTIYCICKGDYLDGDMMICKIMKIINFIPNYSI